MGAVGTVVQKIVTAPLVPIVAAINPGAAETMSAGLVSEGDAERVQKGVVGGATGAASGFVASGFNPAGAVLGAVSGGVSGGINNRNLKDSVGQSAVYGGITGAAVGVSSIVSGAAKGKALANAELAKVGIATSGSNAAAAAAPAAAGSGLLKNTLGSVGVLAAMQALTPKLAQGMTETGLNLYMNPAEQATLKDAVRDVIVSGGGDPQAFPSLAEAPGTPWYYYALALLIPGGLILAAWYWLKHRKR